MIGENGNRTLSLLRTMIYVLHHDLSLKLLKIEKVHIYRYYRYTCNLYLDVFSDITLDSYFNA